MKRRVHAIRSWKLMTITSAVCAALWASLLSAQVTGVGSKQLSDTSDNPPPLLNQVVITQNLNQPIPLDTVFTDETGKQVQLASYFGRHPAILALVYYECPMLCTEELNGLSSALKMVDEVPGKDFNVIVVSINPGEGPELAAAKKEGYLKRYGHPETAAGWHFMTGTQPNIDALAKAVSFGYVKIPGPDGSLPQFAHASAIQILTPEGRLAQYYMGVEYSPTDLRLGLAEASNHRIGSRVDNILTYCYHYDPSTNRHSLIVARIVQMGGLVTCMTLGGFILAMFRKDAQQNSTKKSETDETKE